jgi:hypothetical protein
MRVLGEDPLIGPYTRLMNWARSQDPKKIELIHIRDWHDPDDPEQFEHLQRFGEHCIMNTSGKPTCGFSYVCD